jgi:DNA replicative helicase MCM subunit Mcm2 (Cdc46/Mcm family)
MRIPALYGVGLFVLLTAAFAASQTSSQTNNLISVSGTVTDASGAGVENAEMVLKSAGCKCSECETPECKCCPEQMTVNIQKGGIFTFAVPHGNYVLEVHAGGLKARMDVDLNTGESRTVDVALR